MARESLSARLDGEAGPVPAARLDEHLTQCPQCRRWYATATALTREHRLAPAPPVPDLTERILAAARAPAQRRSPAAGFGILRALLALVGVAQFAMGAAQLGGMDFGMTVAHAGHPAGPAVHLLNESTAWTVALGTGFLIAAWRPRSAVVLLPVVGVFVAILGGFVVADWFQDRVTVARLASHSLVGLGAVLLLSLCVPRWRDTLRSRRAMASGTVASGPRPSDIGASVHNSAA
ncbi:zf-HC2 domain-containing protein [Nocardia zapadnayensis]|uniref:zf-HC2 domain-containing protein n=1 Tax=Nocardia rhamnosiphila TaxID=426716 RepID=UPI0022455F08|nr:zf-HC2 domain-containing protein [Nocardia zapadnayensis]MCX0272956.1 zf-HC2 domain-containing protein [Nocardia zapadnayensis]